MGTSKGLRQFYRWGLYSESTRATRATRAVWFCRGWRGSVLSPVDSYLVGGWPGRWSAGRECQGGGARVRECEDAGVRGRGR
jgi:hypothetical protein